jgi:hypothetical protein
VQLSAQRKGIAKLRVIVHSKGLSAGLFGRSGISHSTETLAVPKGCATAQCDHA